MPNVVINRQWIALFVMITLLTVQYLVGSRVASQKLGVVVWCLWDVIFLLGGLFSVLRPAGALRFIGTPLTKPLPLLVQIIIRCVGVFAFLLGAIMAINLAINLGGYWNG